ncbi:MAG TPA: phospholipase D-like domain-containing protein [Micromonosporaceae bacterium]
MRPDGWFLGPGERGNRATSIDAHAWTTGNRVRVLVHGATYFARLCAAIGRQRAGDVVLFTDWRGDPDERLDGAGSEVSRVLCAAARRGVLVKGLIWRSHLDKLRFSARENRHLGEEIEAAGGECLLDMRVRVGGSHHQKFVVLRHPDRPELDVAYVGGIDLCHSRRDDASHLGDPQAAPMPAVYGSRPPWHDLQLEIRGPAVGDIEATFRERWTDPAPLTRDPFRLVVDRIRGEDHRPGPLPPRLPDPAPCGTQAVQVLRTYPYRRPGYPFAPLGERSVARGYRKAIAAARHLIYLEDQYLWSERVVACLADALGKQPELRLIAVVPLHPDQDGRLAVRAQQLGRSRALEVLRRAGGERVAVYGLENHAGTPVYVHAKACVIDDAWAAVGSDNVNLRSWTYDSELTCAVVDERDPGFARELRLTLMREHLDRADGDDEDLSDPVAAFGAFDDTAKALESWYEGGCRGPRPPGRLRRYRQPTLSRWARLITAPLYRAVYDPDGRPPGLRRRGEF